MPRKWIKKHPDAEEASNKKILQCIEMVIKEKKSLRDVAMAMKISKSALARHVKTYKNSVDTDNIVFRKNLVSGMVFTTDQENSLNDYLLTSSYMNYGLSRQQVRKLAYEYGNTLNLNIPDSWKSNKMAGKDWFCGFMDRHPKLSLRSPEATSFARGTSFNRANVAAFHKNLKSLYERYKFTPDRIYNCDETGITTAHKPPKVVAPRGSKQVGQATSAERGELVTLLCIINAIGNAVPPVFVFPRKNFKDIFMEGAPVGSIGFSNPSGWMNAEIFSKALDHIIRQTNSSKDNPILLILDNHESHVTVEIINKARDNGVFMLTFPPHCSHRLQPLDISVYSSFKSRYNTACNDWIISNPGKTINIYHIAKLVGISYQPSFTPKNITSGFKKPGIYPFNSEPFGDEEFLTSYVTDRPLPTNNDNSSSCLASPSNQPNNLNNIDVSMPSSSQFLPLSPASIWPFPKAEPRNPLKKNKGRKKGRTKILTDSPEKLEIEEAEAARLEKKQRQLKPVRKMPKKLKVKKILQFKDEFSDSEGSISLHDTSDEEIFDHQIHDDTEIAQEIDWMEDEPNIGENEFVLVKFHTKRSIVYYIARVESIDSDTESYYVKFMRKDIKGKFNFPQQDDCSMIEKTDIIMKLQPPQLVGGTSRAQSCFYFNVDLSNYDIR